MIRARETATLLVTCPDRRRIVAALGRYMQVLSGEFITHHPARITDIHHSFLPAFSGGRPYHQARERGVEPIGAAAHYANGNKTVVLAE